MNRIKIISNSSDKTKKIKFKIMELISAYNFVVDMNNPELVIVIGGDGSMLDAARRAAKNGIPVL